MASLTSYANAKAGNGLGPRTIIATVTGTDDTNVTQAELNGFIKGVTSGEIAGSPAQTDAFTVAAVSGTADGASGAVYVALQGTGTLQVTKGDYFADVKSLATATFNQA